MHPPPRNWRRRRRMRAQGRARTAPLVTKRPTLLASPLWRSPRPCLLNRKGAPRRRLVARAIVAAASSPPRRRQWRRRAAQRRAQRTAKRCRMARWLLAALARVSTARALNRRRRRAMFHHHHHCDHRLWQRVVLVWRMRTAARRRCTRCSRWPSRSSPPPREGLLLWSSFATISAASRRSCTLSACRPPRRPRSHAHLPRRAPRAASHRAPTPTPLSPRSLRGRRTAALRPWERSFRSPRRATSPRLPMHRSSRFRCPLHWPRKRRSFCQCRHLHRCHSRLRRSVPAAARVEEWQPPQREPLPQREQLTRVSAWPSRALAPRPLLRKTPHAPHPRRNLRLSSGTPSRPCTPWAARCHSSWLCRAPRLSCATRTSRRPRSRFCRRDARLICRCHPRCYPPFRGRIQRAASA
mmetsp:Transcript_28672/g.67186  ORF Transcript_28672/g.67186 Transcript_28672/m.67186 type:complete len:411 (+) Transcript_28672:742-1974(+)